jgi:hypothetical protein
MIRRLGRLWLGEGETTAAQLGLKSIESMSYNLIRA